MNLSKEFYQCGILLTLLIMIFSTETLAETTKTVNLYQRVTQEPLDPPSQGGILDESQPIKCILYKESGRCVFEPDVEAIQKYEIYNGTARIGVYYDQYSFVQDAFSYRGVLILNLTTQTRQLSGKVYNY